MGQQYAEQSGRVLWILALALIFIASDQVATSTMLGIGKQKLLAFVVLGGGGLQSRLEYCLGAAHGNIRRRLGNRSAQSGCEPAVLALVRAFARLGIPIRSYIASAWLRPAASAVPFGLLSYWIERRWPAPNLPVYFLQVGAILPTVASCCLVSLFRSLGSKNYAQRYLLPVVRFIGRS